MDSKELWAKAQEALKLTNEEVNILKNDPKRSQAIERGADLVRTKIVAEVVQAKNCAVHDAGARYVVRGNGAILPKDVQNNLCLDCMPLLVPFQHMVYDKLLSGEDVSGMQSFVRCPDTGVECGGIGTAMLKLSVEKSK